MLSYLHNGHYDGLFRLDEGTDLFATHLRHDDIYQLLVLFNILLLSYISGVESLQFPQTPPEYGSEEYHPY